MRTTLFFSSHFPSLVQAFTVLFLTWTCMSCGPAKGEEDVGDTGTADRADIEAFDLEVCRQEAAMPQIEISVSLIGESGATSPYTQREFTGVWQGMEIRAGAHRITIEVNESTTVEIGITEGILSDLTVPTGTPVEVATWNNHPICGFVLSNVAITDTANDMLLLGLVGAYLIYPHEEQYPYTVLGPFAITRGDDLCLVEYEPFMATMIRHAVQVRWEGQLLTMNPPDERTVNTARGRYRITSWDGLRPTPGSEVGECTLLQATGAYRIVRLSE